METGETASERLSRLIPCRCIPPRLTARRICRSPAEGDDLFHEAVLRALSRIDQLREESRFRAWFLLCCSRFIGLAADAHSCAAWCPSPGSAGPMTNTPPSIGPTYRRFRASP